MTDVDGVPQIKMLGKFGRGIGRVVVHVVTGTDPRGTPMSAAVMGDDAETMLKKEEHLRVLTCSPKVPSI